MLLLTFGKKYLPRSMKKTLYGLVLAALLTTAACNKNDPALNVNTSYGSWVFKSVTYGESACSYAGSGLLTATSPSSGSSTLSVSFHDSLPTSSGPFTIVTSAPATATQAFVSLSVPGNLAAVYAPLSGGSMTVSVQANGKLNLQGTSIQMLNNYYPHDTASLTFDITQLQ
jgi:hypothetical protein